MLNNIEDFLNRFLAMFTLVTDSSHGSIYLVFFIGILFGSILQFTQVHRFEKIAGFAMLKDTVVPKMLFLAIGISSLGLYIIVSLGYATYHVKPLMIGALVIGGVLFGIAMAIFGKCPGTGPISLAEGKVDVLIGSIGGLLGGMVFTLYYDDFKLLMGENLGKLSLLNNSILENNQNITILIFALFMITLSFIIPLKEMDSSNIDY